MINNMDYNICKNSLIPSYFGKQESRLQNHHQKGQMFVLFLQSHSFHEKNIWHHYRESLVHHGDKRTLLHNNYSFHFCFVHWEQIFHFQGPSYDEKSLLHLSWDIQVHSCDKRTLFQNNYCVQISHYCFVHWLHIGYFQPPSFDQNQLGDVLQRRKNKKRKSIFLRRNAESLQGTK